ncbi:MAG: nucleotidyl transferase AbiEii/AbiGii toxin family protein [Desulfobacterales bacterium]|nr:nucleotidyl transferase AbiEii/AbiGii toxin family protein [Desulfobacterales bacterium]
MNVDFNKWIEEEPDKRDLRRAMYTILYAISREERLRSEMVLKGGVLLATRYRSSRHTLDLDFSTYMLRDEFEEKYSEDGEFNSNKFISIFNNALRKASVLLGFELECLIQKFKFLPPLKDATFPSLKMSIGYAYKASNSHKRLLSKQCSTIVGVDYSFNEVIYTNEEIPISNSNILAYQFIEIVAEKLRAIIQQSVRRKKPRRQDIYDLYYLFETYKRSVSEEEKANILEILKMKCIGKVPGINQNSMDNPIVREKSKKDYKTLQDDIYGELPDFDISYKTINSFYKSLPWD